MTDLSTRIEAAVGACNREEKLQDLVAEVGEVLTSLRKALKASATFAKQIPFSVADKGSTVQKTSLKLSKYRPDERDDIIRWLEQVQAGRVAFWNPQSQRQFTCEQTHKLRETPWGLAAVICVILKETEIHHKILRRFARLAVYKVHCLGRTAASFVNALQRGGIQTTEKEVEQLISAGSKYNNIAHSLGGPEFLFFLPTNISGSDWENRISKKQIRKFRQSLSRELSQASIRFRDLADDLITTATKSTADAVPRIFTWLQEHNLEATVTGTTAGRPSKRPRLDLQRTNDASSVESSQRRNSEELQHNKQIYIGMGNFSSGPGNDSIAAPRLLEKCNTGDTTLVTNANTLAPAIDDSSETRLWHGTLGQMSNSDSIQACSGIGNVEGQRHGTTEEGNLAQDGITMAGVIQMSQDDMANENRTIHDSVPTKLSHHVVEECGHDIENWERMWIQ